MLAWLGLGRMEGPGALVAATPSDTEGLPVARETLDQVEAELASVEQALTRLDDGTYGICERCRARLHDDVLAGDPLARRCPDHCP